MQKTHFAGCFAMGEIHKEASLMNRICYLEGVLMIW
jgi:hypothetical protein